jgi:hypothetical protein
MDAPAALLVALLTAVVATAAPAQDEPLSIPATREASGTSWQPDSTPMHAFHAMAGDWMLMGHGALFAGYDFQSSRRGGDQWFAPNWAMLMASRPVGDAQLQLRTMLSLEPATIGRDGYPLLLQTGESLGGERLHDVQHPHDLFMELAAIWTQPLSSDVGFQLYVAPAGEPALGPTAFPHRESASSDPFAPITHHWQDATHISYGVLTGGLFTEHVKLEGSWFNGREPDENRWDLDVRAPDSWSARLTVNPNPWISAQVSAGWLHSPEELEPDQSVQRTTASISANLPVGDEGNWATTFAWGRNKPEGDTASNSFLIEANFAIDRHHVPFGRIEYVRKSGEDLVLQPSQDHELFPMTGVSLGYLYQFDPVYGVTPSVGVVGTLDFLDHDLEPAYSDHTPYGFALFVRFRPAPMHHGDGAQAGH